MADINRAPAARPDTGADHAGDGPMAASGDEKVVDLIELVFFAYRDFVSDPDAMLADLGFGRAHHRVLHFVDRNPGLTVAELLDILKITKQSLGRVLKELVDSGFVEQRTGALDRRQRLLHTTPSGQDLARRLSEPQAKRIAVALRSLPPGARRTVGAFLYGLIDEPERAKAARLSGSERLR